MSRFLRVSLALGSLLLALARTPIAHAQGVDRAQTSGPSVGAGVGLENSGLGAHALYYLQLSERWRLAPHVGVGWIGAVGVTGGVMAAFGRRHRLVLDFIIGPMAADGGTKISTSLYYGGAILVGYEWMAPYGLAIRTSIGPSYRPSLEGRDRFFFAINFLSIDYKFW